MFDLHYHRVKYTWPTCSVSKQAILSCRFGWRRNRKTRCSPLCGAI